MNALEATIIQMVENKNGAKTQKFWAELKSSLFFVLINTRDEACQHHWMKVTKNYVNCGYFRLEKPRQLVETQN